MRQPSNPEPLFDWWRQALAGKQPQITGEPQIGFYKTRLINRHRPWVPARIWLHQKSDRDGELVEDERLRCQINGEERDPVEEWTALCLNPITRAEFEFMCADAEWCEENAPADPKANPRKKIDFLTCPLPLFNQPRGKNR